MENGFGLASIRLRPCQRCRQRRGNRLRLRRAARAAHASSQNDPGSGSMTVMEPLVKFAGLVRASPPPS